MCSRMYRISHKIYMNLEHRSLEGRSHFSSFIWFDFISFENQKQKRNALINKYNEHYW